VGLERYELLQELDGKVAFESMLPVVIDRKPTLKNPLKVTGIDPEFYLACSGFPAESHEPVYVNEIAFWSRSRRRFLYIRNDRLTTKAG